MALRKEDQRDGMLINWDVPIEMDDGVVLRADVYRPPEDGSHPVILSYGPYGKWLHFEDRREDRWNQLITDHPEIAARSSNRYQNWETVNPEVWIPEGYVVARVDSRGAGRSPGYLDVWSKRETLDLEQCIEWAGTQSWSNGRVGLSGISYYAMNQWQVATLQPDHLEAMCIWEGAADWYRELARHGGIYSGFGKYWYDRSVESVQHGVGARGFKSRMTGGWVSGPETLTEEELGSNRTDLDEDLISNELSAADYWEERNPDWSKVDTPFLSAANWGGHGLHTRGNFEGFMRAATDEKWLEIHGLEHWTEFYTDYGLELQKEFFGHYLKGEDNGWTERPPVIMQVREHTDSFHERTEDEWPLERTDWTKYFLHPADRQLSTQRPDADAELTYESLGDGVTFLTDPFEAETEITGPMAAKLFVSSDTEDADLFLVLRLFDEHMSEITFNGAVDPNTPPALGWLRASHRKLDEDLSTPWRPYHTHDEIQPLEPGEVYELDVEIWPTCLIVPAGFRLGLSVRGRDYEYPGGGSSGVGVFNHDDPRDRPVDVYGGETTIVTGPERSSHVLLPIIPDRPA